MEAFSFWCLCFKCHLLSNDCFSDSKSEESAPNAGDSGMIPGLGISPREGNGTSLQYSCLDP